MMDVNIDLCERYGLDVKKVRSIATRLSKAALEAEKMGMEVFGGSGSGSLRYRGAELQGPGHSDVAHLDGIYDGGDGGDVF